MKLRIFLPTRIFLDEEVQKVTAEAENGAFGLLPRHLDFATALAPGIISFLDQNGEEKFVAADRGILVKAGDEVMVSVMRAVYGEELGKLRSIVEEEYKTLDEREKKVVSAAARLEAGMVRRFMELG